MSKKKKTFQYSFQFFLLLSLLGALSSCLPADSARLSSGDGQPGSSSNPNDSGNSSDQNEIGNNAILQSGQSQTTGTLDLQQSSDGNFLIKSSNINSLISNSPSIQYCLAARFSEEPNKIYLARAQNFLFNDFSGEFQSLNTWLITPNDNTSNQSQCSGAPIESSLQSAYGIVGSVSKVYKLDDACPTCSSRTSQTLTMVSQSGNIVSSIFINQKLRILDSALDDTVLDCSNGLGQGCNSSQCCVDAQCVSHGQIKPGVDENSQLFQATLENILAGTDSFSNNQNYFYVCANGAGQNNDNTDSQTGVSSQTTIEQIGEYLACQPGDIDEQGICTVRFENASQLINPLGDSPPPLPGYQFSSRADDLNFSKVNSFIPVSENKIVEIRYADEVLFKINEIALDPANGSFTGAINDDVTQAQSVLISATQPTNALNDTLIIKYKTDVSCTDQGNSFVKCRKFFNIGQLSTPARPSDHVTGSNNFLLPEYANVTTLQNAIILTVDGNIIPRSSSTWEWSLSNPRMIVFQYPLLAAQKVIIEYFVKTSLASSVGLSSRIAKEQIAGYCGESATVDITLTPLTSEQNGATVITGYECQSISDDIIPAEQTISMSTRHAPHLFYNDAGAQIIENDITNDMSQELSLFEYTGFNPLKPNNKDTGDYIGFNEIYGSFNTGGALPAKEVLVKKGKLYNIRTEMASYTPCPNCGNDYYAPFLRMFPTNSIYKGAGIEPDNYSADRSSARVRSDDFLFGRGCFLPATMIPWSHVGSTNIINQRRSRLQTQHALFANGYNKDWFGFDYGSLIGSFDGVSWFSIGNLRQVTAKGKTLYLAINGYFSDLSLSNNITVSVSEVLFSTDEEIPDHDSETDGAQCQRAHFCETDNDCLAQLGYDYTCSSVDNIKTSWPVFNINSKEIVGQEITRLTTLFGGTNSQSKRCVYRGQGALCSTSPVLSSASSPIKLLNKPELHTCSPSHYCASVSTGNFNNKIARYARGPQAQNSDVDIATDSDLLGLSARILGRPYDYQGNETLTSIAQGQLVTNQVNALCLPGRAATSSTLANFTDLNMNTPSANQVASILGTGVTLNSGTSFSDNYLSACPATDDSGGYFYHQVKNLNDLDVMSAAIQQNMSTNLLTHSDFSSIDIFNDNDPGQPVEDIGLKKNSCMRAPGATCFSNFECAPNNLVASQISNLTPSSLNLAEFSFWQEGLICSQKTPGRDLAQNPQEDHILNQNRCCRETGKKLTIFSTQTGLGALFNNNVDDIASINTPVNDNMRYSRLHTIYDKLASAPVDSTLLKPDHETPNQPIAQFLKGYDDFHNIASRTCCSQSWVRNFHQENSGGHVWTPQKMQTIDKSVLKTISWSGPATNFITPSCDESNYMSALCGAVALSDTQVENASNYFATLELVGIPQVAITPFRPFVTADNIAIDQTTNQLFIDDTIANTSPLPIDPQFTNGVTGKYSAQWQDDQAHNFTGVTEIKPVFSENEFTCCKAALEQDSSGGANCCSGNSAPLVQGNQAQFCCLPNYTNVSVYLNRYVSSEATDMDESLFDPETGYLNDPEIALQKATNICCSGKATLGRVASSYKVPGLAPSTNDSLAYRKRFLYLNNDMHSPISTEPSINGLQSRAQEYDAGVRWNTQIYCIP